jgi:hypothetical protein
MSMKQLCGDDCAFVTVNNPVEGFLSKSPVANFNILDLDPSQFFESIPEAVDKGRMWQILSPMG